MKRWETYVYIIVIVLLNTPLLFGRIFDSLIFSSPLCFWQILSHPFIHVSWYHLLLDGSAFLLLYSQLAEPSRKRRTIYVAVCGLSSLAAAIMASPNINSTGYCGLSGIGHGLMAVCGLEMLFSRNNNKSSRLTGLMTLAILIIKCSFEAITGNMLFHFMHGSLIGSPVALAHTGGVIGGGLMYSIFNLEKILKSKKINVKTLANYTF